MKIILEIPKSAVGLAAMVCSDDYSEEAIEKATKACEESPVSLSLNLGAPGLTTSGVDKSDLNTFNMAIAMLAIVKKIEEQKKEKKEE